MNSNNEIEWSSDTIKQFIILYEKEPALWDTRTAEHKNQIDKLEAWYRIKRELKDGSVSLKEIKKKRENLYATYRRIRSRVLKFGPDNYKPDWPFYNIMSRFLDDLYSSRPTLKVPRPRDSPQLSDSLDADLSPSTSHVASNSPKKPKTTIQKTEKVLKTSQIQDEYDSFALTIAQSLRAITDLKQREDCMNTIRDVITQFVWNNQAVLPDSNQETPSSCEERSEIHKERSRDETADTHVFQLEIEKQEPFSPNNDLMDESENALSLKKVNDYFDVDVETRCLICSMTLDDGEQPRAHLLDYHAGVLEKIMDDEIADSDASSTKSNDDQENIRSETIFLPTKQRKIDTKTEKGHKRRRSSTAQEKYEVELKDARKQEYSGSISNNQLISFLNYISLLLNKMSPDLCTNVQFDILNVIMTAQRESQRNGANREQVRNN